MNEINILVTDYYNGDMSTEEELTYLYKYACQMKGRGL